MVQFFGFGSFVHCSVFENKLLILSCLYHFLLRQEMCIYFPRVLAPQGWERPLSLAPPSLWIPQCKSERETSPVPLCRERIGTCLLAANGLFTIINPRRHWLFRDLPRYKGGGVDTTPRVWPLIELKLRDKKRVGWSPREEADGTQF